MNKDAIKGFLAWLDTASMDEIRNHQAFILERLSDIRTAEGKADAKLALRLIDEELLARMQPGSQSLG